MRNRNGTGTVYKLKDKPRRNPWVARITNGYNEKGYPKYVFLSDDKGQKYFPDDTIPRLLLAQYNIEKNNINIDKSNYTFKQVYEEYSHRTFPNKQEQLLEKQTHKKTLGKLGISSMNNLRSAYNKSSALYDRLYKSLRKDDFMQVIYNTQGCATIIDSLANLYKKLDNYALEQDIIIKGYANLIKITDDMHLPIQNEGSPYTYQEIDTLWKYQRRYYRRHNLMHNLYRCQNWRIIIY